MSNIIEMFPSSNIADTLRDIADKIDSDELEFENITLIGGTEVFQIGDVNDEDAAENAIFNMNVGIHKLMTAIFRSE